MRFEVAFTERSLRNLADIHDYIAQSLGAPRAAALRVEELYSKTLSLSDFPFIHPELPNLNHDTMTIRYFVVGKHICLYTLDETVKSVTILSFAYARSSTDSWLEGAGEP